MELQSYRFEVVGVGVSRYDVHVQVTVGMEIEWFWKVSLTSFRFAGWSYCMYIVLPLSMYCKNTVTKSSPRSVALHTVLFYRSQMYSTGRVLECQYCLD